jgi:photosystem II stability/assembly factor-like uncharacterized protein
METTASEGRLSRRGRRALPLMALALLVLAVTAVAYVHPSLPSPAKAAAATPAPPLLSVRYQVAYDFLTATSGWALVADAGSALPRFWIFKTTDAAKHWQRQLEASATSTNSGPLKIQFFDQKHGLVAVGGGGTVYRTEDGGVHWTALTMPNYSFSSLFFSDRLHGWILGTVFAPNQRIADTRLFSTADAGDHWNSLPQPPGWQLAAKGGFGTFGFRSPSDGWLGGLAEQATVYSTIDGGITWQAHPLPVTFAKGGFDQGSAPLQGSGVYLLPGAGVLAVAFDPNGSPVGFTSFDGGSTWRRLPPAPGETTFSDFVFLDTFHWWAMRYGTLFKSSDAGQSWKEVVQQLDEWDYIPQAIDAKHAWALMTVVFPSSNPRQGTGLAITSDGGAHWTSVKVPNPS